MYNISNMHYIPRLELPNGKNSITDGDIIILNRFETTKWVVRFGWYSYDGNHKMCGWYLKQVEDSDVIKPLLDVDLYDIYFVDATCCHTPVCYPEPEPQPDIKFNFVWALLNNDSHVLTIGQSEILPDVDETSKIWYRNDVIEFTEMVKNIKPKEFKTIERVEVIDSIELYEYTECDELFEYWTNLEYADLSKIDFTGCYSMIEMFKGCTNLKEVIFGDCNSENVASMRGMFENCENLIALNALFDTENVTNFSYMFYGCKELIYNASYFDTSSQIAYTATKTFNEGAPNVVAPKFNLVMPDTTE